MSDSSLFAVIVMILVVLGVLGWVKLGQPTVDEYEERV